MSDVVERVREAWESPRVSAAQMANFVPELVREVKRLSRELSDAKAAIERVRELAVAWADPNAGDEILATLAALETER